MLHHPKNSATGLPVYWYRGAKNAIDDGKE